MSIQHFRPFALAGALLACTDAPRVDSADTPDAGVVVENAVAEGGFLDPSLSRVTRAQMLINGIGLDTPASRVLEVFGQPTHRTPDDIGEMYGDTISTWHYPGMEIAMSDRKVSRMECRSAQCVTADGLRVGASRASVVATYGPRGFGHYDSSIDHLTYFQKEVGCWLSFRFANDLVNLIELRCDHS